MLRRAPDIVGLRYLDGRGVTKDYARAGALFGQACESGVADACFNYGEMHSRGQGVALARLPLVAESLASGALLEPLPACRMDSPLAYWLMVAPRSAQRPEVKAFCDWIRRQAEITRHAIGDVPDPETLVDAD